MSLAASHVLRVCHIVHNRSAILLLRFCVQYNNNVSYVVCRYLREIRCMYQVCLAQKYEKKIIILLIYNNLLPLCERNVRFFHLLCFYFFLTVVVHVDNVNNFHQQERVGVKNVVKHFPGFVSSHLSYQKSMSNVS